MALVSASVNKSGAIAPITLKFARIAKIIRIEKIPIATIDKIEEIFSKREFTLRLKRTNP